MSMIGPLAKKMVEISATDIKQAETEILAWIQGKILQDDEEVRAVLQLEEILTLEKCQAQVKLIREKIYLDCTSQILLKNIFAQIGLWIYETSNKQIIKDRKKQFITALLATIDKREDFVFSTLCGLINTLYYPKRTTKPDNIENFTPDEIALYHKIFAALPIDKQKLIESHWTKEEGVPQYLWGMHLEARLSGKINQLFKMSFIDSSRLIQRLAYAPLPAIIEPKKQMILFQFQCWGDLNDKGKLKIKRIDGKREQYVLKSTPFPIPTSSRRNSF